MNRTQRRAQMRAQKRGTGMAQQASSAQIQIRYGHDHECVLMIFSQAVSNNRMTVEQAEAMRAALADAIEKLKAHRAKAGS